MSRTRIQQKAWWENVAVHGILLGVFLAAAAGIDFWYGRTGAPADSLSLQRIAELEAMVEEERKALEETDRKFRTQVDDIAGWFSEIHADILRLNALGERLVEMAELDADEFDFDHVVPMGGLDDAHATGGMAFPNLMVEMDDLPDLIDDRRRKLKQIEQLIMEKQEDLKLKVTPSGWPVRSGYITSRFGYRIHPILKKPKFHSGIDFAGKLGTPVLATAEGVVIFSGWQSGYGRIVKIRHSKDLVTYYAHNRKNLVKEGDKIEKGQTIAKLGSSGRSTGPHVHFEVRRDGKAIDPLNYISTNNYQ